MARAHAVSTQRPLGPATLAAVALGLAALVAGGRGAAQPRASYGQYLVVVDDSGSMDQSDPRRLVVMASLALAGALDDGDQVMFAGLNELANGEVASPAFVSPRDVLPGRDGPAGARPVAYPRAARIGQHAGGTPCQGALARARELLNAVAAAGAPQTLLMLTDGACNGAPVEAPEAYLGAVRAHQDRRFRFVLLARAGPERPDPTLVRYAAATGWRGDPRVAFDARALLRAFADVLSFTRGLRYDDGGRVGLERTFAGARVVRVLAVSERGAARIELARAGDGGDEPIPAGPTWQDAAHGWSLRVATERPRPTPYAIRAVGAGVDVLVVPTYGTLRVESVFAPCADAPPPLPWTTERAVRAGQPACAWARLVGDAGVAIEPGRSFDYAMELCEDAACARATPFQPGAGGAWNLQVGAQIPAGRHERWVRARGGALAEPVTAWRGFTSMAFGVSRVALASAPDGAVDDVDLGVLPRATASTVQLQLHGAFPAGARARVRCVVAGDPSLASCVRCAPAEPEVALQDPTNVQLEVDGAPFCEAVSAQGGRDTPVRVDLVVEPVGDAAGQFGAHHVPMHATLRYAGVSPVRVRVTGGGEATVIARLPGPAAQTAARVALDRFDAPRDLAIDPGPAQRTLRADETGHVAIPIRVRADDCCHPATYTSQLVLEPRAGQALRVGVVIEVLAPGFWVCPGRKILRWTLAALALLALAWVVRGFVSPAKFRDGALLLYAESHDALSRLQPGDDGWREVRRFAETARGFRRHAAVWLGGPRAPLPSLKRMSPDARIEAEPGGGAKLIVTGAGVQRFEEGKDWYDLAPGTYPVHNSVLLKRGESLYLQFRR